MIFCSARSSAVIGGIGFLAMSMPEVLITAVASTTGLPLNFAMSAGDEIDLVVLQLRRDFLLVELDQLADHGDVAVLIRLLLQRRREHEHFLAGGLGLVLIDRERRLRQVRFDRAGHRHVLTDIGIGIGGDGAGGDRHERLGRRVRRGGGACRPAVVAVNEVTKAASARAATITVDLVERCIGMDS